MATGGSAVAIILLARANATDGSLTGTLAACLTAPHILGPIFGRWLDATKEPKYIITAAAFLYPGLFQLAMWGFQQSFLELIIISLLMCGACSSLLMGGLSTQLIGLVDNNLPSRRRAQSWDNITYGLGLTIGPLLIATLVSNYSIYLSVTLLMSFPVLAGLFILRFPSPQQEKNTKQKAALGFKQVLNIIYQSSQLKRTIVMTSGASFSIAALPVLSVYLSEEWQRSQEQGAYLVTFYGIGCLCGALLLIAKPMKANAMVLLRNIGSILLISILLVMASPSFSAGLVTYWLCGVINSIFFVATLAARSEYAPEQGAAQIYLWVAAAKISAASIGTFITGYLVDISTEVPLIVASTVLISALTLCFWRR